MSHVKIIYPDWGALREIGRALPPEAPLADCPHWAVTHHGRDVSSDHPDQYEVVYEGERDGEHREILGRLFEQFNIGDREGLRVRSMSVGDLVEIDDDRYVCAPAGWDKTRSAS